MLRRSGLAVALILSVLPLQKALAVDDEGIDELQTKLGNEWVLVKNDKLRNIKTFAKQEDGKRFRSFKVEASLEGTAETGARVLLDFDNYNKWYWEVQESRLIKKVSATEYYLYLVHRAPFSLPNRDVILHASVEPQTKSKKEITLRVKAVPDFLEQKPPLVRMQAEDMTVTFTPQANNHVLIEAEGYVDPGGNVPTWANNFIQRSAPYSILVGLQRMVIKDEYIHAKQPLPFPVYDYTAYDH